MKPSNPPSHLGPVAMRKHRLLTRPPRIAGAMIMLLSSLIVGLIILANHTAVPQVIRAPGEIMPEGRFVAIETMEGGIVEAVLANDGDQVVAGTILLRLRNPGLEREYVATSEQIATAEDRLANTAAILAALDMQNELDSEEVIRLREAGLLSSAYTIQIFVESQRIQDNTILQQQEIIEELSDAQAFIQARIDRQRLISDQQELLFERGLIQRSVYISEIRHLDQLFSSASESEIRISEARNSLAMAIASREQERLSLIQETLSEHQIIQRQLSELEATIEVIEGRRDALVIRAPFDGYVQADVALHPGAVIAPGELLFELLPERQALIFEIRVPSDQIGQINEGQEVTLSIDTFDVRRFGQANGILVTVAPASMTDERTGDVYFRAQVHLDSAYLGEAGFERRLQAGMTGVAELSSGERSLLAAFLGPIHRTLSTAFSENI